MPAAAHHNEAKWLTPLIAALTLAACTPWHGHDPAGAWTGEPWTGGVSVVTELPGSAEPLRDLGTGSARFTITGDGTGELVVAGVIGEDGRDVGFSAEGRYGTDGWIARYEGIAVHIAPDGRIEGGGRLQEQVYRLDGSLSATEFDLVVDIEVQSGPEGQAPPVSTVRLTYDLSRRPSDDRAGTGVNGVPPGPACGSVRMAPRNVPSLSGGAMSTIDVPVCDD